MYAALKSLPAGSIEDEIYSALSIAPNIHRASGASPPGGIRATAWFDWRTCGAYPPISTVIKSNKGKRDDRFPPTKCHVAVIYISLFLVRISVSLLRSLSIINLCSRFFSIRGVHISFQLKEIGFAWKRRRGGQIPGRIPGRVEYKGGRFRGTRKLVFGGRKR